VTIFLPNSNARLLVNYEQRELALGFTDGKVNHVTLDRCRDRDTDHAASAEEYAAIRGKNSRHHPTCDRDIALQGNIVPQDSV
jgi:hypothetical protein